MNERQLEGLLKEYGEALGPGRRPEKRAPVRRGKLGYAIAFCAAATAIMVSMWPQDAAAGRIRRMEQRIKNAKSMEMTFWQQTTGGQWFNWLHVFYQDGNWRYQVIKGKGQAETDIERDGLLYQDYQRLDHATVQRATAEEFPLSGMNALDYAKQSIDSGQVSIERKVSVHEHAPVDGRATYVVAYDRPEDAYHAELLVDSATDLPISADVKVHYSGENGGDFRFRQEYRFNQAFGPDVFEPTHGKPVVDLRDSESVLGKRWTKPLVAIQGTEVREATVGTDGTIWLAVTCPQEDQPALPIRISGYGRLWDLNPSTMSGRAGLKLGGKDILVVGFFPLDPSGAKPDKMTVSFGRRPIALPNFSTPASPDGEGVSSSTTIPLSLDRSPFPGYFTLLDMDRMTLELPADIWHYRGIALKDGGNLLEAAHSFEKSAREHEDFVKYIGYRELDLAAACYDKLGMAAEADRARKQSADLKAARER